MVFLRWLRKCGMVLCEHSINHCFKVCNRSYNRLKRFFLPIICLFALDYWIFRTVLLNALIWLTWLIWPGGPDGVRRAEVPAGNWHDAFQHGPHGQPAPQTALPVQRRDWPDHHPRQQRLPEPAAHRDCGDAPARVPDPASVLSLSCCGEGMQRGRMGSLLRGSLGVQSTANLQEAIWCIIRSQIQSIILVQYYKNTSNVEELFGSFSPTWLILKWEKRKITKMFLMRWF